MKIKKAVFPVAGLGSRFLPATKANPKEMLPIVDKPLIHYAVEEAVLAGITDLILVTSSRKSSIEDYFDRNVELEAHLEKQNKHDILKIVRDILPANVNCIYIRQPQPLGLGDAVLCARPIVGDEPFAVLLADDLMDCKEKSCLQQMCEVFLETSSSIVAVESITPEQTDKYGVVALKKEHPYYNKISGIVEKPKSELAPSHLGVAGRYILTPGIFNCLQQVASGHAGEVQLTDAISLLLKQESVYAYEFIGKRHDCGSKLGYLEATIAYALKHPQLSENFSKILQSYV
ncbi:MAG: UTP--glucose-1-phosphate uridylyltransferase GalU [Gammaproteobacteria bacterium]